MSARKGRKVKIPENLALQQSKGETPGKAIISAFPGKGEKLTGLISCRPGKDENRMKN